MGFFFYVRWAGRASLRENSCRGSSKHNVVSVEAGVYLACSRNNKEAVPRAQGVPQRVIEMRAVDSRGGS